jgi:glycosyltransferase involved in cell wall biosynthesis
MSDIISVAFLTSKDPNDKNSWSGTLYQMLKVLRNENINVILLGPLKIPRLLSKLLEYTNKLNLFFSGKEYNEKSNLILSKYWAHKVSGLLKFHKPHVIFAPIASTEIALLKTRIPICYLSDSSFMQLNGYYRNFSNFSYLSKLESDYIERRAIRKAASIVYPSQWASDFVLHNYKACKSKISVLKLGANINIIPEKVASRSTEGSFKVLFVGLDWERKGGPIVYETIKLLFNEGYNLTLTICGCNPAINHPAIKIIPYLDKSNDKEEEMFAHLLAESHLFFLPTRAECFGIVFSEASAYGIPSLTTNTGGVSSAVENGVNGFILSLESTPGDYAEVIKLLINNKEAYREISENSRKKYERELNWDVWGKNMKGILLSLVNRKKHWLNCNFYI